MKNYKFTYNGAPLECVREYKYLGFTVTPSGEVRTGLEDLRRRGLKAYMKMKNTLGPLFRHNVENSIHLYSYMVSPILTYCSDFWGCLQPKNNPVEKIHLMFLKHLLGVRKQTNTDGVLLETGMIPLSIYAVKSATKNWERIQQGKANPILITSNNYSRQENLPWASNIRDIFSTNGMHHQYIQKINETEEQRYGPISNKLYKQLTEKFHLAAFDSIKLSSKMKTLKLLKNVPGREQYLADVNNSKHRIALTRLRLSAHQLEIEAGRWGRHSDTSVENRLCTLCHLEGNNSVEDEIHFLVRCPVYQKLRGILLAQQVLLNKNMTDDKGTHVRKFMT